MCIRDRANTESEKQLQMFADDVGRRRRMKASKFKADLPAAQKSFRTDVVDSVRLVLSLSATMPPSTITTHIAENVRQHNRPFCVQRNKTAVNNTFTTSWTTFYHKQIETLTTTMMMTKTKDT